MSPDTDEWLRQIDSQMTQLITAIQSRPAPGADICIERVRNTVIELTDAVIDREVATC